MAVVVVMVVVVVVVLRPTSVIVSFFRAFSWIAFARSAYCSVLSVSS